MSENDNEQEVESTQSLENEMQETGKKVQEVEQQAKEAVQGAKDGANLAKNIGTGNYLGAAKDALNLAKNKKVRRMIILQNVMPIVGVILILIILASFVLGIFDAAGDAIQKAFDGADGFFRVKYDDYGIIEITDEALDAIIESIENLGISLDDLHLMGDAVDYTDPEMEEKNKEALRKYIRQFYEAQAVTQTLYTNPSWYQKIGGKTYGTVYVQRTKEKDEDLSKTDQLEYISYEEMQKMVEKQDKDAKKYFSVDENDNLVIAGSIETTIKVDGKVDKDRSGTVINLKYINYKSVISQYTTTMNFMMYLTIITQNPEFAAAVADLVKDSDIKITLMDKVTTNVTVEERTYIEHTKTVKKVESTSYDAWDTEHQYPYTTYTNEPSYDEEEKTEITETEIITTTPIPAVTYAKTWFSEQTIGYNKTTTPIEESSYKTDPYNENEPELNSEGSVTWITSDVTTVTTNGSISEYVEGVRGDVIDRTGEKGDGKKSFVGLLDVKFRIPNSKHEASAGGNLISGAEMFFYLLQKDSNSQNLENIMRYILYKYTGKSYGVTELDLSAYDIKDFETIGDGEGYDEGIYGSSVEEKFWNKLKSLGYSDEAVAGAMGNISCESGFNPKAVNRSSGAYGLAQWLGGRRTSLKAYAASKGKTEDDENIQIEFLVAELTGQGDASQFASRRTSGGKGENHRTYDDWANATSVDDAAVAYCWFFETPSTSSTRTSAIIREENKRITAAQRYYNSYKGRVSGGTYNDITDSYGVKGYYTASNGKKFTILNQTAISGWSDKCNRAACAIIASGYSDENSTELIKNINDANRNLYGAIPGQGNSYWSKYGLNVTSYESNLSTYESKLRNQLKSGGYALLWLNNNSSAYYGSSGTKWTSKYHWVAVIDYRNKNGTEEICVADYRGATWVKIDEFKTHGIAHMVFVNEK